MNTNPTQPSQGSKVEQAWANFLHQMRTVQGPAMLENSWREAVKGLVGAGLYTEEELATGKEFYHIGVGVAMTVAQATIDQYPKPHAYDILTVIKAINEDTVNRFGFAREEAAKAVKGQSNDPAVG